VKDSYTFRDFELRFRKLFQDHYQRTERQKLYELAKNEAIKKKNFDAYLFLDNIWKYKKEPHGALMSQVQDHITKIHRHYSTFNFEGMCEKLNAWRWIVIHESKNKVDVDTSECPHCGLSVGNLDRFCPHCGSEIK